ncbi:MAG: SapC family protein [Pseudoalteromonas prydzensis]|uniref:SapC family protein n=1 Tax=Pseudoalteromonas prydzensis TaxID=182141 RepID=UPI003F9D4AAC
MKANFGDTLEQNFKFDLGDGDKKQISGLFSVDRDLLNTLSDEELLELQKSGMLEAIYSQLISLGQFQRLIDKSRIG